MSQSYSYLPSYTILGDCFLSMFCTYSRLRIPGSSLQLLQLRYI